jgi:hypothetical protein
MMLTVAILSIKSPLVVKCFNLFFSLWLYKTLARFFRDSRIFVGPVPHPNANIEQKISLEIDPKKAGFSKVGRASAGKPNRSGKALQLSSLYSPV